ASRAAEGLAEDGPKPLHLTFAQKPQGITDFVLGRRMTHRSTVRLAAGVLAGLWIGTMAPSVLSGQSAKTVNDAVYTAAQAERGRKFFESSCTTCHEVGRFSGPDFIKVWEGESLYAIYDLMRTTMPEDNPGGLQPQQYADITAYFLQLNDFPA